MYPYHKIETLFRRDDRHQLTGVFRRPVIGTINQWDTTEKIDGTNIRIGFERHSDHLGRNQEINMRIGGRTNKAQLPVPLVDHIHDLQLLEPAEEIMEEYELDHLTLYGEGYGAKIQKGGGNYRDDQGFILFDVNVGLWLQQNQVTEVADRMGIPRVPMLGVLSLDEVIDLVQAGFSSLCAQREHPAEGVVARPVEELRDNRGKRIILKLKTKDFADG